MLRFIIKKREKSFDSCERISLVSLDIDVPELETLLKKGGYDQYAYEHHELVGAEILAPTPPKAE